VIREAVGVAAEEDEFTGATVAEFTEPFGEGVRIEVFPAASRRTTVAAGPRRFS